MEEKEIREIGYIIAGYIAARCEDEGGNFCDFGADAIKHCYEYKKIIDAIEIPYTEKGLVDTEEYREAIYQGIYRKHKPKEVEVIHCIADICKERK